MNKIVKKSKRFEILMIYPGNTEKMEACTDFFFIYTINTFLGSKMLKFLSIFCKVKNCINLTSP